MSDPSSLTREQLREEARKRGLQVGGSREDLLSRLTQPKAASDTQAAQDEDVADGVADDSLAQLALSGACGFGGEAEGGEPQARAAGASTAEGEELRLLRLRVQQLERSRAGTPGGAPPLQRQQPAVPNTQQQGELLDILSACLRGGNSTSLPAQTPSHPLLIPDFADERFAQTLMGGRGGKKGDLEKISFGQWVVANARIAQKLLSDGALVRLRPDGSVDTSSLEAYLRFNMHVGKLIDGEYDWRVVLRYDQDMRLLQHSSGRQWDTPDLNLISEYLTAPRNLRRGAQSRQTGRQRGQTTASGQPICFGFNSPKGCHRQQCNYAHVCSVCEAVHPACQHSRQQTKN
jgi:hypothetical protein